MTVVCLAGQTAKADQIDDILAGKPVVIEAEATAVKLVPRSAPQTSAPAPDESALPDNTGWDIALDQTSGLDLGLSEKPVPRRKAGPPAPFSVVPEPSAIALAAASLVYFLIFFRRRYSV